MIQKTTLMKMLGMKTINSKQTNGVVKDNRGTSLSKITTLSMTSSLKVGRNVLDLKNKKPPQEQSLTEKTSNLHLQ